MNGVMVVRVGLWICVRGLRLMGVGHGTCEDGGGCELLWIYMARLGYRHCMHAGSTEEGWVLIENYPHPGVKSRDGDFIGFVVGDFGLR